MEQPFDLQRVLANLGGDRELLDELIVIFLDDYPKQLERLREALAAADAEGVRKCAHTIKGSVGVFAADQSWNLAYDLEKIGGSGDLNLAKEKLRQVEDEISRLTNALGNLASND